MGLYRLNAQEVAAYLRKVGIQPANMPRAQPGTNEAGTDTGGDGFWDRFGSANQYGEQDPDSFPEADWPWQNGSPYNETTTFNATGRGGQPTPGAEDYSTQAGALVSAPTFVNPVVFTAFPFSAGTGQAKPSPLVVPANQQRCAVVIQNLSVLSNLYVNFGAPANANLGILLVPDGSLLFDVVCPNNDVYIFFPNAVPQPGVAYQGTRNF
jgi:hypothetical protein